MRWLKNPTIRETIRLNRLHWFWHVQKMEENRIPPKKVYINLETTRLRGRPRNRWQDEVKEDGRLVGGKGWKERAYNREVWKKLLRTTRNRRILNMAMELMEYLYIFILTIYMFIFFLWIWFSSSLTSFTPGIEFMFSLIPIAVAKLARGSRQTVDFSVNLTLRSSLDTVQTEVAANGFGSFRT